ncbi:MAG: hypothetical protein ACTHMS_10445 [Jatrophihabitans sp.]|uniref:hypothetical protein n=1 Tax=Jatrophihabitans sp. TaxID=1932789 RepID=UPI003F7DD897
MTPDPTATSGWEPFDPYDPAGPQYVPAGFGGAASPPGWAAAPPTAPPPSVAPPAYPPPVAPGPAPTYGYPPPPPYGGSYPVAGYGPYGGGYVPNRPPLRPGVVTAASVVAWVLAGLLILCALGLFTGAKFFEELHANGYETADLTGEFVFDGIANGIAAALLITGGVQYSARRPWGRGLVLVGGGIAFALSVYWIVRLPSILVFWSFVFATISVALLVLGVLPAGRRWLADAPRPRP